MNSGELEGYLKIKKIYLKIYNIHICTVAGSTWYYVVLSTLKSFYTVIRIEEKYKQENKIIMNA